MKRTQTPLIPFDAFCPSIQNEIPSRLCSICKQYIPLGQRLRNHYKVHQQRYAMFQGDVKPMLKKEEHSLDDLDPVDPSDLPVVPIDFSRNGVFLFTDLVDWLKSDFEDDQIVERKQKSVAATAMAAIRREKQLQAAFAAAESASIRFNDPTRKDPNATITKLEPESNVVKAIEKLNVNDEENHDDLNELIEQI